MFVGGIDKEDADLKKKPFKINFNEHVPRSEMKTSPLLVFILRLSFSNTVHTSSNKMTGSVRISQAMLALFLSPPDSPGIISPPITATSEQENSINIYNSQFFQFGLYCIDVCIHFCPL